MNSDILNWPGWMSNTKCLTPAPQEVTLANS